MKAALSVFIIALVSCNSRIETGRSQFIIGDWSYVEPNMVDSLQELYGFRDSIKKGYLFSNDGICEKKLGYFKKVYTPISGMEKAYGARTQNETIYFLGTTTKYKIVKDVLKIFDLSDSSWKSMYIISLSSDTLIIKEGNDIKSFVRTDYSKNKTFDFDQVIISSSGCFGRCPINNTIIDKSGGAVYFGERHNSPDGLYSFQIPEKVMETIISNFNKADIENLKNDYEASWTDDEYIYLTFLKDRKIIKRITDYGRISSKELIWAYTLGRNVYQISKLDTITMLQSPFANVEESFRSFQFSIGLFTPDNFYLWNLLRQSKETTNEFIAKYEIDFKGMNDIQSLQTDGRFYKFRMSDGTEKIFDIRFDFIETNSLQYEFYKLNKKVS